MPTPTDPTDNPSLILAAIAELHDRGHGRLKLFCYFKEGVGAWRYWLFASDSFPSDLHEIPEPYIHGSITNWMTLCGSTANEVIESIKSVSDDLYAASRGADEKYTTWFKSVLAQTGNTLFEMESPFEAKIGHSHISTPYT